LSLGSAAVSNDKQKLQIYRVGYNIVKYNQVTYFWGTQQNALFQRFFDFSPKTMPNRYPNFTKRLENYFHCRLIHIKIICQICNESDFSVAGGNGSDMELF
jgi:hypothetical protein